MIFETLGDKSKPAILLIHGMFCSGSSCKLFAKYLENDYYIILPTLDGHYNNSPDYISKEEEAGKILDYLRKNGIQRIALLQGTSMGAEVAMEIKRQSNIRIDKCFFDGGPFFDFPKWFKKIMEKKFKGMANVLSSDDPQKAADDMMNNVFVKWLAGKDTDKYKKILADMTQAKKSFSDTTVKNVTETCYAFKLPDFDTETQKSFLFFFSSDEPAHMSKKRLVKKYGNANFKDIKDYGHAGFQMAEPKKYAELLHSYIEGKEFEI